MRKFFSMLLSASIVLSGNAAAINPTTPATVVKAKKVKKCVFPKSRKRAPSWVCNANGKKFAVGSASKSAAGDSFMEQQAAADARVHLAQNLRGSGRKKIADRKDAANKAAVDGDKTLITNETLEGTKILKRAYGPDGTLYVLVGFDQAIMQKLK